MLSPVAVASVSVVAVVDDVVVVVVDDDDDDDDVVLFVVAVSILVIVWKSGFFYVLFVWVCAKMCTEFKSSEVEVVIEHTLKSAHDSCNAKR